MGNETPVGRKEIEERFYNLGKRIAQFDLIKNEIADLKKQVAESKYEITNLHEVLVKNEELIKLKCKEFYSSLGVIRNDQFAQFNRISPLEESDKRTENTLNILKETIENTREKIAKFIETLSSQSELIQGIKSSDKSKIEKIEKIEKSLDLSHEKIGLLKSTQFYIEAKAIADEDRFPTELMCAIPVPNDQN